jgi:ATP-dependent Clp protease protease subunit
MNPAMKKNKRIQSRNLDDIHSYGLDLSYREIYFGDEEESGEITLHSSLKFVKNLNILNSISHKPISIHMFSLGGHVDAGFGLYDCIKNSPSPITIYGYGSIASMASIVLQAASLRCLTKHSSLLLHDAQMCFEGDSVSMHSFIASALLQEGIAIDIYAERSMGAKVFAGKTIAQVKKFYTDTINEKRNWCLTAQEALNYGLIDKIVY